MGRFGAISPPVPPQTPGAAAMAAKTFRLPRLPVDGYVLLIVLCAAPAPVLPSRRIVAEALPPDRNTSLLGPSVSTLFDFVVRLFFKKAKDGIRDAHY